MKPVGPMFILNSELKKIIEKILLILIIFILINLVLFISLRDFKVAYRPLDIKAKALFTLHKNPTIIIGGDSIAESGIDPQLLTNKLAVNIAAPASGIQGFLKAILKYSPHSLRNGNILILNISSLSYNDSVILNDYFIGQADGFLNAGFFFLLQNWKKNFFKNISTLYKCSIFNCPYLQDSQIYKIEELNRYGYIPKSIEKQNSISSPSKINIIDNFSPFYQDLNLRGQLFNGFQRDLQYITSKGVTIFIAVSPPSSALRSYIKQIVNIDNKIRTFNYFVKKECEKYPKSCYYLDYWDWDHGNFNGAEGTIYYDHIHFTEKGGEQFTEILKRDINSTSSKVKL